MQAPDTRRQSPLRLADHVRACKLCDQVVLLDLRRSKYVSLSLTHWRHLLDTQAAANNEPQLRSAARLAAANDQPLLEPLLRQGLLARTPGPRRQETPSAPALSSWEAWPPGDEQRVGVTRAWRILRASAWAALALRTRSLQQIADRVSRRPAQRPGAQADQHPGLDRSVAAFHKLRPLLFSSRDRCLHDSLALVSFLAGEGIAAHWVIGVKSQPFAAHAWVQAGSLVLNDLHENVRHYEPILVV
jgi:Transglutaminase-like superfamily